MADRLDLNPDQVLRSEFLCQTGLVQLDVNVGVADLHNLAVTITAHPSIGGGVRLHTVTDEESGKKQIALIHSFLHREMTKSRNNSIHRGEVAAANSRKVVTLVPEHLSGTPGRVVPTRVDLLDNAGLARVELLALGEFGSLSTTEPIVRVADVAIRNGHWTGY